MARSRHGTLGGVTDFRTASCEPILESPLAEDAARELADLFKVLADPVRLRLVSLIAAAEGGEACACDLNEPIGRSQPTTSHHLSALVDAGLVRREKRGRWAWYRIEPESFSRICAILEPRCCP